MIKVLIVLMLATPFICIAQTDTAGFIVTPHIATAIGKPNGEKVSVKMNKDGGTIKSIDGRVELIFPEGAISSKTNISIQPITNNAPGGVGNGYEFEPSGTIFKTAVQLIFHYTKEELDGTLAGFKNMATQHKDGKWYKLKNILVDTTAKTITSSIKHFSSYVSFDEIKISPAQVKVKVGKSIYPIVTYNSIPDDGIDDLAPLPTANPSPATGEEDLAPLPTPQKKFPSLKWFVNGVPNGNSITGTIKILDSRYAKYTAPAIVPDANPVAVTAELKGMTFKDNVTGTNFKDLTLVSNVTVYDKAYQITVIGIWKDIPKETLGDNYYKKMGIGEEIITDTSSFILHLNGNKSNVTNIQNMFKYIIINRGKCTCTLLNEAIATGAIQIDGIESITVIPSDPPKQPSRRITIKFKKPKIVMPDVVMECKGARINNSMARDAMAGFNMGFPTNISFMENELKDYWATQAGINEYQVIIKPMDDK
jgi:hypothetical protein